MQNSFESPIQNDLLAGYQNGYDGLLKALDLHVNTVSSHLEGAIELLVVSPGGFGHRVEIVFTGVSFVRISSEFFVGGGCVLYNGGRLLWSPTTGELVLDLDPGVAWLSPSGDRGTSSCLVSGTGTISVSSVE